ncbi:O-antigen polymerase [Cutibacterium equinum]|uniref:O-antigen polymerase n=1 Tax=Cutibacterium equinum TaxID=3016342 RepID=A0ABY7QYG0_9ACTN|nr:O-antigen ligase family protein [Cutibacterium equinum]WCC80081.1 O-antigen polymerase [Cutibacterium equinum]
MTRILIRVLVALLPLTVLFGTYAAVGPLTSFRAVVAVLAVVALAKGTSWPRQWPLIIVGAAWVVVGVVSGLVVSWTPAWGDLANLVVGLVLVWALSRVRSDDTLGDLTVGWEVAILISLPIAVWEHRTTRHLPQFIDGLWRGRPLVYPLPGTFFPNPNYYALFLVLGLGLIVWHAMVTGGWQRWCHVVMALASVYLLWLTGSKLCLMGALLMAIGAALTWKYGRMAVGVVAVVVAVLALGPGRARLLSACNDVVAVVMHHANLGSHSWPVRLSLLGFGLHIIGTHPLLGVGPGGFAHLARHPGVYSLHHKTNPHNGLIHVACDYGVVVAAVLVVAWVWGIVRGFQRCAHHPGHTRQIARLYIAMMFAVPALMMANSVFVGPNVVALWMAVLVLLDTMVGPQENVKPKRPMTVADRATNRVVGGGDDRLG